MNSSIPILSYPSATALTPPSPPVPQSERGVNSVEFTQVFRSEMQRYVVPVNTKGKESEALITLEGSKATAAWSGQEVLLEERRWDEDVVG